MTIVEASTKPSIGEQLFGREALHRTPYRTIVGRWKWKASIILPLARLFIYPIAISIHLVLIPWYLFKWLKSSYISSSTKRIEENFDLQTLKPPV
jgi:hypothetical protein